MFKIPTKSDYTFKSFPYRTFASQCKYIQNLLTSENDDDVLLNHINSKYYDVKIQIQNSKLIFPEQSLHKKNI